MSLSVVMLADRGVLRLSGEDRATFLQGLVSNDVRPVAPDRAVYACLLTPQGRFLHDFILVGEADAFLVDCEAERRADLRKRLSVYRLRAKIAFSDETGAFAVAAVPGEGAAAAFGLPGEAGAATVIDGVHALVDPRMAALGVRLVGTPDGIAALCSARGIVPGDRTLYERHRLALAVPDGSRDMAVEQAILLESNIDHLNGIAWDKGCYMGQELTARTRYRGLVKKRILPVSVAGAVPPSGTPVTDGTHEVGTVLTGQDGTALALLRLDAARDALAGRRSLSTAGLALRPTAPPYAPALLAVDETAA